MAGVSSGSDLQENAMDVNGTRCSIISRPSNLRIHQRRLAAFEQGDVAFEDAVQVGGSGVAGSILGGRIHLLHDRQQRPAGLAQPDEHVGRVQV